MNIIKKIKELYYTKKIKLYRQSGKPSNIESAMAYETEFKSEYDKLWKDKEDGKINIDEMRESLVVLDKKLSSKYPMYLEVKMPSNELEWKDLIMKCEAPLVIAITEETKELALFIMDSQY